MYIKLVTDHVPFLSYTQFTYNDNNNHSDPLENLVLFYFRLF